MTDLNLDAQASLRTSQEMGRDLKRIWTERLIALHLTARSIRFFCWFVLATALGIETRRKPS
jgi:hypothetical protein